jgi:hypothetical protein
VETFDRAGATEEIRGIILSYPELIDSGDLAGVGRLLAGVKMGGASGRKAAEIPEAELEIRSAEEVQEMYGKSVLFYEDGLPHTKHLITNIDISFSEGGDLAHARSYYTVIQRLEDFPLQMVIAGRYEDVFEDGDGGWRLAIRREYSDLVGDLSRHVSPDVLKALGG